MPAITGCCWPRGISTASCSLRCWGGSGRCLCQAGNGRRLRRRRDAGLLKRELLGAVSAKSPPASWNAAIERHSATQTGANGASIVRGRRRPCTRAADRSILTIAGMAKTEIPVEMAFRIDGDRSMSHGNNELCLPGALQRRSCDGREWGRGLPGPPPVFRQEHGSRTPDLR